MHIPPAFIVGEKRPRQESNCQKRTSASPRYSPPSKGIVGIKMTSGLLTVRFNDRHDCHCPTLTMREILASSSSAQSSPVRHVAERFCLIFSVHGRIKFHLFIPFSLSSDLSSNLDSSRWSPFGVSFFFFFVNKSWAPFETTDWIQCLLVSAVKKRSLLPDSSLSPCLVDLQLGC